MSKATIPTGIYVIENVDRCNDVFLGDDGRALVAGSSDADADPPSESCWKLTRLRNGRYLIRHAEQQNRYACWPVGFCQGSEVVTSPTPHHWVVTEAKVKETYVISHARCQLYWGIEDDEEGRPVRLRYPPTGSGNQWKFHRLSPTTVTPQHMAQSQNIDGNVDRQTVPVSTPSQPKEVDGGQPARATPVVPQTVIESLTIDGGLVDSQTATTPNQSQTREVIEATSAAVIPQDVVEPPNVEKHLDNQAATIPILSQTSDVDKDLLAVSTPVIPQSVVWPLAIDESNTDSQLANIRSRIKISEAVDDRPSTSRPTSVVPQNVVEPQNIGENPECKAPTIPTQNLIGEEVDDPPTRSTPVIPRSVSESRTIGDDHTTSDPSLTRNANDDRPAIRHILKGHTRGVCSVAFSPDGDRIVSASRDLKIRVWDVRTRKLVLKPIEGHTGSVLSVAFSPDGTRFVSGSSDKTVRIWDAQSGTLILKLNGHTDLVRSVACSPDGKRVVSGSADKTLRVWDVETGSLVLGPLLGHTYWVNSVNFSTDGKHILSGSRDGTVRVWDAETGHAVRTLCGQYGVWSASFSPDSRQIVSGGGVGIVAVWDMLSNDSTALSGHKDWVYSVGFSPDGGRIVSGGMDHQIIVWDAKLGKAIGRLEGHSDEVNSVAFSPDGKWIVSGSWDKTVRIWEADRLDAMPDLE